jgi:S1-C subfamily serine protease
MDLLKKFSAELEALVAIASPSVVGVLAGRGQGTGLVLAPDGYILTNSHVVDSPGPLSVQRGDGRLWNAERVGVDARTDLAVLRADARFAQSLQLAERSKVSVGQLVVAIGNPFRFERSVSLGVVSALDRSLPTREGGLEGLIQTDAAINPGNSGGPLMNADGEVVGINTAIIPFAQGIGFAIPSHTATWVAAVLMQKGRIDRPQLGIAARGEELEPELQKETGQSRAIRVHSVASGAAGAAAGLAPGDLLLSANGQSLFSVDELQRVLVLAGEREVELSVLHSGARRSAAVRPSPFKAAA